MLLNTSELLCITNNSTCKNAEIVNTVITVNTIGIIDNPIAFFQFPRKASLLHFLILLLLPLVPRFPPTYNN